MTLTSPVQADVRRAADVVVDGGLVVYPTETVYALGADAGSARAVELLLKVKGRNAGQGMSLLVTNLQSARALLAGDPPTGALELARLWWPGPLTLVLPAAPGLPGGMAGVSGGIGLRCSSDPVAAALLEAAGTPLTATSANRSGDEPATDVETARGYFGEGVACYLDGGPRQTESASTVVEFLDGRAYLRRCGPIDVTDTIDVEAG